MANDRKAKTPISADDKARAAQLHQALLSGASGLAEVVGRTLGFEAGDVKRIDFRNPNGSTDRAHVIVCFVTSDGSCGCYDLTDGVCFPC